MPFEIEPVIVRLRERRCGKCGRFWACEFEFHGICPICAHSQFKSYRKRLRQLEALLVRQTTRKKTTREKTKL